MGSRFALLYGLFNPVTGENKAISCDANGNMGVVVNGAVVTLTVGDVEIGGVYLKDGSNTNRASISSGGALKVDASASTQPVSAVALPLPSGAATSTAQTTAQTSLSSIVGDADTLVSGQTLSNFYLNEIDTKLTSPLTVGTHGVTGTFWQATQPVSLAALPVGHNIIDSGSITISNASLAVTGTFWQATQPVSAASLPLPTGAATETTQLLQSTAARQDTGNVSLASLDTKVPAKGQTTSDYSVPVVMATDQQTMADRIAHRIQEMQMLDAADGGNFALQQWSKERVSVSDRRGSVGRGSTR